MSQNLESLKMQIETPKQKAIFVYLNNLKKRITKFDTSLEATFESIESPFNQMEIYSVVGNMNKEELIMYQFWLDVLDMIAKIDEQLFLSCQKLIEFIKELCFYKFVLIQEDTIKLLKEFSLSIPINNNLCFIKGIKSDITFESISAKYFFFIETTYLSALHLYSLNYLMDRAFEESKDLKVAFSLNLLKKAENIFFKLLPLFAKKSSYNKKDFLLTTIYKNEISKIQNGENNLLKIYIKILSQYRIYLPITVIDEAINYANKKLVDEIFKKEASLSALDNQNHSDTL